MEYKTAENEMEMNFDLFMLAVMTVLWKLPVGDHAVHEDGDEQNIYLLPPPNVELRGLRVELDFEEFGVRQLVLQ